MNAREGEIRALTGLRGMAALDVAICHVGDFVIDRHPALHPLFANSAFDVDLFFCLSAVTLCIVYGVGTRRLLDASRFFIARFARVYPLAILALLVTGPYFSMWGHVTEPTGRDQISIAFRQLLLVNHWPIIGTGQEWLAPLWSLSVEVFLYIFLFPCAVCSRAAVISGFG